MISHRIIKIEEVELSGIKNQIFYTLGDKISIEDRFGNTINASITELIFSQDVNGYKAYPTIETIGAVDGMDQLVNIFINNPIYVNIDHKLIIPDIREELEDLRSKTYIAYYVANIIDYFLNDHLIYTTMMGTSYKIVAPPFDDMDKVVLGDSVTAIYANPSAHGNVSTKAIQFVKFMMDNQVKINGDDIVIPPLDGLASYIQ